MTRLPSNLDPATFAAMPSASSLITEQPDFEAAATQGLPAWWRQGKQAAWSRYQELPFPHGKNEPWRFATTSRVKLDGFQIGVGASSAAQTEIREVSEKRGTTWELAFANDQQVMCRHPSNFHEQGLIFCSIQTALHRHADLLEQYFMTQDNTLGGTKFAALNRAHCHNGLFLYIPKGLILEEPIEVFYWLTEAHAASFPHNLVIAESHSKAEVRFFYRSTDAAEGGLLIGVSDFFVGAGANVRNVQVQNLSDKALSLQMNSTVVERDAHALSLHLNLGGSYARLENKSRMVGAGGRSDMLSLTASHCQQEFDQRTFQEHAAPNTVSDLLYKNALADDSRTIFAGMIDVDPAAQHTNAYQSNRNLLLSGSAEANSLPGLEIMANDVRCTHGATTGQLNQEELFYMLQRGIPLPVARKLFVLGFFDEVIERLKDAKLGEELHRLVEAKFETEHTL